MRRPRGPGGRFLTADEIAAQKAIQAPEAGPSASTSQDGDDDDADQVDRDLDKDMDMALDSPSDAKAPFSPIRPSDGKGADPPPQPLLQPRPQSMQSQPSSSSSQHQVQPQLQPSLQPQMQAQAPMPSQSQMHSQSQSQSSRIHAPVRSPYESQLSLGHNPDPINLLNVGYRHSLSHPATPAPLSPMPSDSAQTRDHVHLGHSQHDHSTHDHSRQGGASATSSNIAGHLSPTAPPAPSAPANGPSSSNINLRSPYAAMQMHHVPHPHAHARHHHSYINNVERLYPDEQDVIGLATDPLKGDLQPRANNMLHYGNNAGSARR